MTFVIDQEGVVRGLYTDAIDLKAIGEVRSRRASYVEPSTDGTWTADMALVGGPILGPFDTRAEALATEVAYLEAYL